MYILYLVRVIYLFLLIYNYEVLNMVHFLKKVLIVTTTMSIIINTNAFASKIVTPTNEDYHSGPTGVQKEESASIEDAIVINSVEPTKPKPKRGALLGRFKTTAYCIDKNNPTLTATGTVPTVGRTVGANWKEIPAGTKIMIGDSDIIYIIEDTGNVVNTVDIFMSTYEECIQYGVQYKDIYLVE